MSSSDAGETRAAHDAASRTPGGPGARFPWVGMIALATAAFLAVTSETLPTGLLPEIAGGLHVTTPQAGLLVSVYAFTVVIAATPLTALTRRVPRRPLVVIVIVIIGLSALLLAIAPNYAVAVIARIIGGMAHGVFWAVTGAYAGHIVAPHHLARAVSISSGGVSLALILGAPLGTILGHALGWQAAFAWVGGLLLVGAFAVGAMLPRVSREPATTTGITTVVPAEAMIGEAGIRTGGMATVDAKNLRGTTTPGGARGGGAKRRDASIRPVIVICVLMALITLGNFTLNAYVAPFVADAMGLGTAAVGPMLFVGGLMGAISVALVGTVLGRFPNRSVTAGLALTTVAVAVLGAFAGVPFVAIVAFALWALAFGCLPPLVQTQLLHAASARFRDTASALYTTAFNVGIGGGAVVGGLVYSLWGIGSVPWAALAILAVSLVMLVTTTKLRAAPADRRSPPVTGR